MNDLSSAHILVTGATGFLGRHLLPLLLETGANVGCLVRKQSAGKALPAGAQRLEGDCGTGQGMKEALANRDIIIHMAGLLFGTDWQQYMRANAQACQNILKNMPHAAKNAHVVFISSLAAASPHAGPDGVAENIPSAPVSAYGWSKFMCEQILAKALGDNLTVIRPPIIYGSGDRGLLPLFKSAKKGIAISPGAGRKFPVSIIHASDAARAIVLAARQKRESLYHLNDGAAHDMDSIGRAMGRAMGASSLKVMHMPLHIMAASAAMISAWGWFAGSVCQRFGVDYPPPHWNMDKYREARVCGWVANGSLIERELGFRPQVDIDAGMKEAVDGYRSLGWL